MRQSIWDDERTEPFGLHEGGWGYFFTTELVNYERFRFSPVAYPVCGR